MNRLFRKGFLGVGVGREGLEVGVMAAAEAEEAWDLISDARWWPRWGPSVREVRVEGAWSRVHEGMAGRVRTALGFWLPFEIHHVASGTSWDWKVAGVNATSHRVEPEGRDQTWVWFRVPFWAGPYAVVCLAAGLQIRSLLQRRDARGRRGMKPVDVKRRRRFVADCPRRMNCVSSEASDPGRRVPPLRFEGETAAAWRCFVRILEEMPRATVVKRTDSRVHVAIRSGIWGFVDDLEGALDAKNRAIHIRSASRKGYWDLGVNRNRVEAIRAAFVERCSGQRKAGPCPKPH